MYTLGTIAFRSHQDFSKWAIVITDTLHLVPIAKTAAIINVHPETVFNMRHKILLAVEKYMEESDIMLEGLIEVDETYLNDSYKGKVKEIPTGKKPRKHGEKAKKEVSPMKKSVSVQVVIEMVIALSKVRIERNHRKKISKKYIVSMLKETQY